jgi:hypothetical protein
MLRFTIGINFYLHEVVTLVTKVFRKSISKVLVQIFVLSANFFLHNPQGKFT